MTPSAMGTREKITKVAAVPAAGMVTKVGRKVPMIDPMVLSAMKVPTVRPLSFRLSTAYLVSDGVTVPSSTSGKAKSTRQVRNDAQARNPVMVSAATRIEMPGMR